MNTPPCLMNCPRRGTFSTHSCSPSCVEEFPFSEAEAHGSPPLQIAILHCGWTRTRVKHSQGGRRRITYAAPCGRKLRDLGEVGLHFLKLNLRVNVCQVHKYLLITGQQLEIDMFNFDWWVQVQENLYYDWWVQVQYMRTCACFFTQVSLLTGAADI